MNHLQLLLQMTQVDPPEVFERLIDDLEKLLRTPCSNTDTSHAPDEVPLSEEEHQRHPGQRRVNRKRYKVTTSKGPLYIDNWKFREFDFSKRADKMPCLARGLFTSSTEIVVRGYDKFFNIDELPAVKRDVLKTECKGPFNASIKENGCIMFFAGLSDGTLLVCSKNVTGDVDLTKTGKLKHYEQGMSAITKQVAKLGKTTQQLALELYRLRVTAVAELCDDSYEEHVVPYPPERAGLYLHGLNHNKRQFETLDMDSVATFADQWGFTKVEYSVFETFDEVMNYATQIENEGKYFDREIEGLVIRCKRSEQDYFFKYKIEQPYFLYRQFREATLKLFSNDNKRNIREVLATYSDFKRITLAYLEFAQEYFAAHPEEVAKFGDNTGIIKLRQEFLKSLGYEENQGLKLLEMNQHESLAAKLELLLENTKTVYVLSTIAVPGCGKTTTAMTLCNLFSDWKHFQNDDYSNAKGLYTAILQLFLDAPVIIMDRVNYRQKYRQEAFESLSKTRAIFAPDVEIKHVGLNFIRLEKAKAEEIYRQRILDRGDNHQSLKAKKFPSAAMSVLTSNLASFEGPKLKSGELELPVCVEGSELLGMDSTYNIVINMDVDCVDLSLKNAKIIYQELRRNFPELDKGDIPESAWQEAFHKAKQYQPTFSKNVSVPSRQPVYYGIRINREPVVGHLEEILRNCETWKTIKENKRIQDSFHMTLSHAMSKSKSSVNGEIWTRLGREFAVNQKKKATAQMDKLQNVVADVRVEKIVVIDNVLVVLKVKVNRFYKCKDGNLTEYAEDLPTTNKHLHVTIGTKTEAIKPRESNSYLEKLFEAGNIECGTYEFPTFTAHVYDWGQEFEKQVGFINWKEY